jgi:hypothetical protein
MQSERQAGPKSTSTQGPPVSHRTGKCGWNRVMIRVGQFQSWSPSLVEDQRPWCKVIESSSVQAWSLIIGVLHFLSHHNSELRARLDVSRAASVGHEHEGKYKLVYSKLYQSRV